MPTYNPKVVEPRWQRFWDQQKTFRTSDHTDTPKFYILDMFPYPSGAGLHVGHPEGYTATDILARYKRMRGFNVLHPIGWDAFGLPAEQYAIETGTHPRVTTQKNIDNFRRQIKMLGFSYDWDREVDTTDPNYFKWTQWIFLQLFDTWFDPEQNRGRPISELPIPENVRKQGDNAVRAYQDNQRLAYQAEVPVNWCEALGTVLANEEVVDGKSERGNYPVVRMPLRQWLLRITAYAERLLDDLDIVAWPDSIKKMQREWIGRSVGAEVDFDIKRNASPDRPVQPAAVPSVLTEHNKIRVFTTRPDTLFGATYMVLAPEHRFVDRVTTDEQQVEVERYRSEAAQKSDLERTELAKKKTGVFTGGHAINPVNGEAIPIWIADYVLATYGTGAIMAVPAHDDRDFEFARQFGLPIRPVVLPPDEWFKATNVYKILEEMTREDGRFSMTGDQQAATLDGIESSVVSRATSVWGRYKGDIMQIARHLYRNHIRMFTESFTGEGIAINSGAFEAMPTAEFKQKITEWLDERGTGTRKNNYKHRDWLFSRQRYWGEPFPILHELDDDGHETGRLRPLSVDDLPLTLPKLDDFKPSGKPEPPLGKAHDWLYVTLDGKRYKRETNTMPQWAGSCWYYLRYIDPHNQQTFCHADKERYWMPVDLYVGGAEHAVLHLLYARFWHKVLFDRGHVSTPEPFQRLVNQGMILGEMEYTAFKKNGDWVSAVKEIPETWERIKLDEDQVEKQGDTFVLKDKPKIRVDARAYKMSKSRGNVINPDQVVDEYGADSMRLYEMFMGPLEATKPWSMSGVEGVFRFLNRVWRLVVDEQAESMQLSTAVQDLDMDKDTVRKLHQTIKKVTEDLDNMAFNTAISSMMEFSNLLTKQKVRSRQAVQTIVLLLGPFAPHLSEELWRVLGHESSIAYEPWPTFDESLTKADQIEVPVQINGKVRHKITVAAEVDKNELEKTAMAEDRVKELIEGKNVKKVIVVPKKLVNIVVT